MASLPTLNRHQRSTRPEHSTLLVFNTLHRVGSTPLEQQERTRLQLQRILHTRQLQILPTHHRIMEGMLDH